MFTLYTPQTANKVLPEVRRLFSNILIYKKQAVALQEQVEMILQSGGQFEQFIKKKQELNAAVSNYYRAIEQLEATGVVIKDVEQGLLDFPSKRFDEEVWLCWKMGESEIKFWHGKDEGFMGRKPLGTDGFLDDLAKLR
ncbi:MAG TPA: DUF2203 domain-containing protein [Nitrososphaera sp.]|nr:DUF2203 domain-containing protein [Nitrososphaera sp.]